MIDKSLLGHIGTAEMQIEIEKWVRILDRTDNKTNVSTSMNEDDIKLYIQDVVSEVRKKIGLRKMEILILVSLLHNSSIIVTVRTNIT